MPVVQFTPPMAYNGLALLVANGLHEPADFWLSQSVFLCLID